MPLLRGEIHKTVARLRLLRNELIERDFLNTAENLVEAIVHLENVDKTYINELADKKKANSGK